MTNAIQPFHLLVIGLAGRLNRQQQTAIDYLIEENRVLKYEPDEWRIQFTVEQRMRLVMEISKRADTNDVSTQSVCSASILIERGCVSQLECARETSKY